MNNTSNTYTHKTEVSGSSPEWPTTDVIPLPLHSLYFSELLGVALGVDKKQSASGGRGT